jgi:hypothetical protein
MKEINERLNDISELIDRVDAKVLDINTKLDELIKALHEYDGDYSNETYGESSFEAFQDETTLNKRMDIIGQNGNEGSHYVTNEEADDDANNKIRVVKDKDSNNNIQPKQKQYYKNKRSKRSETKKFTQDLIPKNK